MNAIKERTLLVSGPLIRPILADIKTETRRLIKDKFVLEGIEFFAGGPEEKPATLEMLGQRWDGHKLYFYSAEYPDEGGGEIKTPYGKPGDRLWLRETWAHHTNCPAAINDGGLGHPPGRGCVRYKAQEAPHAFDQGRWVRNWFRVYPAIHMPRWASRILLEITDIWAERVQDITEAGAMAEGVEAVDGSFIAGFRRVWESIYGPGAWDRNEWVWVVKFKRVEGR